MLIRYYGSMKKFLQSLTPLTKTTFRKELLKLRQEAHLEHKQALCLQKQIHLMPDGVLSFFYKNQDVAFFLPKPSLDLIQREICFHENFWEVELLERVQNLYDMRGKTVLDIGANIGNHSVFYALVAGASQVHAFEPQREAADILARNVKLNELAGVRVHSVALGEKAETGKIQLLCAGNKGESAVVADALGDVSIVTLDSLNLSPDFIKIDVEGAELQVLRGAVDTLKRCKPVLQIEIHKRAFTQANQALQGMGYRLTHTLSATDYLYEFAA